MKHFKNPKFSLLILVFGLLVSACDNQLTEVDPINEAELKKQSTISKFNLTEISDYSNLRKGDFTGKYLVLSRNQNLNSNLMRSIENAGGEIVKQYPEIGVLLVTPRTDTFLEEAGKINGVESITPDLVWTYTQEPGLVSEDVTVSAENARRITAGGEAFNYRDAIFDGWQWAPKAINATDAWDAGYTGEGIRVAVLDGGFHSTHIDLAPNLDVASSASFVPGFAFNQDTGTFWHGTHVAGIVAASGFGVVGIAPKATLVGVKVLHNGSGAFSWILDGIIYAATPQNLGGGGAQVMNMSLGATIDYRNNWQDREFRDAFRELQKIYDRVTRFAFNNGVTVIASSGNGETNYDEERELFKFPAQNQHVLSISSTGPTGWVLGNTNFSDPAYYTDFGKSLVDFAAPGGTVGLAVVEGNFNPCTLIGTTRTTTTTCAIFDQVFSTVRGTSNGNYNWAQGTSMASPAAAGVVALMMQANGGNLTPAQVKTRLMQSSTDLGKPGQDEIYGHGFVNAAKAVGINN
ncbi:S8 family peptidase [Fontibacter flavus]|uniref:S8 family serine peptidase n=1 Tax=Fontibacter flavus TaxID=654838 RepID=A0ABV6FQ34_9BACT